MIKKSNSLKLVKIILYLKCFVQIANAETIPTDWNGVRSSGMGASFTANANDETAIFSNPSGLKIGRAHV